MRELKFRVWCKRTQEYHTPIDEEDYDADGTNLWLHMCIDTNGRLYYIETTNEDADFEYITHDCEIIDSEDAKDFIVEQYTGLKDKNGKEIYEGDIIEYDWYIIGDKPAYRVRAIVKIDDLGATLEHNGDVSRIRYCTGVNVIGNIHENPELMEEE